MAQGGLLGNNTKVGYASGSPHTWKKMEQVLDVKIPTLKSDKIDITTHSTGGFKRNMAGLKDVTDMEITMLYDPDAVTSPNQNSLYDLLAANTEVWWRVEFPAQGDLSSATYRAFEFQGRVLSFEPMTPIAGRQEVKAMVTFSGTSFSAYAPTTSALG